MTKNELYRALSQPNTIKTIPVEDLQQLMQAYPYTSAFKFLYLYKLSLEQDIRYDIALKKYSVLLPSRQKLYALVVDDLSYEQPVRINQHERQQDPFVLIEDFLGEMQSKGMELPQDFSFPTSIKPTNEIAQNELSKEIEKEKVVYLENQKNANFALPGIAQISFDGLVSNQEAEQIKKVTPVEERNEDAIGEDMFTETLARIYLKQKRYEKALQIIRSLQKKCPEKSPYYEAQIRYLERLVIISNKV